MKKLITIFWSIISIIMLMLGIRLTVPYNVNDVPLSELPSGVTVGQVRVQLLSDSIVRIEQKGARGFENRPSFTAQKRTGWDKVAFTVGENNGTAEIKTAGYTVKLPSDAQDASSCLITDADGNELWHFAGDTDGNVFLPSPSDELKSWYFTDTPRVIPSEDGYSFAMNGYDLNGWDVTNDAQDVFVFLPDGDYGKFTRDFTLLTGSAEMLTLKYLGFWDSRYYEYNEKSALRQINDYYDRGYPLDVITIDTDWRLALSGAGYTVNSTLFPNMERFLAKAHDAGVSVVFNDHPEPVAGTDNLLDKREIRFRNENLKKLLGQGLDCWWYDRNWWTSLKPVEDGLSIYTSGMYAYHYITRDYYESAAKSNEYAVRPVIMANVDGIWNGTLEYAPGLASHRYSLQWTGDVGTSSADLADEIFNAVFCGSESGLPYVSADLGGHTAEVTSDMYSRWIQFGALSPICRVHCTKPYSRMPWLFGETAEKVTREYVGLRYRLLPLFYALSHENYETGLPLVRRLDINYPQYAEADANDEYLLGDYLLVAPINESYPETRDYVFTSAGNRGLKGEYFANDKLSGSPEITRYDERVSFDWGYNAPWSLSISDYFSVRWSGDITVGDEPVFLRVFSDDGVRVYLDGKLVIDGWNKYDTYFSTDFIPANSTHSIVIEYCDGNNHAHIFVTAHSNEDAVRDVFIPDGEWTDLWTGETYSGPDTVKVSHPLETSPLFVRAGSVFALADNMKNTDEKEWSHLTLEVFPSSDNAAQISVYEDDVRTVAYKSGEYRKTGITLDTDGTLTVFPAEGSFNGERAFNERSWTVRVHGREDFGCLTGMKLNGKAIAYKAVERDAFASPLAITGGARDNTVYEVTFTSDISEKNILTFTFEKTAHDTVNADYDRSEASFGIGVRELEKDSASFTISAENTADWLICALNSDYAGARKKDSDSSLSDIVCNGTRNPFDDNYRISFTDGEAGAGESNCGIVSNRSFTTEFTSRGVYKLYLGGYKSLGKLTVRDRAGNVKTVTFGDMNNSFCREITVETDGGSELEVTYSILCGENITAAAIIKEKQ